MHLTKTSYVLTSSGLPQIVHHNLHITEDSVKLFSISLFCYLANKTDFGDLNNCLKQQKVFSNKQYVEMC